VALRQIPQKSWHIMTISKLSIQLQGLQVL
jgi:hypothetical protein